MEKILEKMKYGEWVQHVKSCEPSQRAKNERVNASNNNGIKFTQTKDLEEAIYFAENGWDAGIEEMKREADLQVSGNMECVHSVEGGFVV